MADKKEVIQNWPLETGDYAVGNVESPVAVVSLGSNMNDELVAAGAAISGPLHTENLGIEKVVENGIDEEKKSIIGSPGAIPFVENLPVEAVERFQKQVSIVSMINNEDVSEISSKIDECISNDPGAYDEDAMIVEFNETPEEEFEVDEVTFSDDSAVDLASIVLLEVENRISMMNNEIKQIASLEKISSGYYAGKIEGIVIGFILTLVFLIIIIQGL